MYYGDQRIKTQAAREWTEKVVHQLNWTATSKKLETLRDSFDPQKHVYIIKLTAYYPEKDFYTKSEGTVSSRTQDISNWEKPLIDIIFLKKYFEDSGRLNCQNLNTDDKYICSMQSRKLPTKALEHEIHVTIGIINKPSVLD